MVQRASTALVKLSRPRLFDIAPRPRLFKELDGLLRHPLVWIAGPTGAGKTTLAASYIEARARPCLWYQVDAGDLDTATFFHYLALGAAEHLRPRHALPTFDAEYLTDLPGFTRRFFRQLFAALREGAVVLFDNFEEAASSGLTEILRAASDEIPHHCNVIILSRADPPQAFAQSGVRHVMAALDPATLNLTADEAREVAKLAGLQDERIIRALHTQADGWTAGVRLIAEHARAGGPLAAPHNLSSHQALFGYFAEEMFARGAPGVEQVLLRLAPVQRVTATLAQQIGQDERIGAMLDDLATRHLFVERRMGQQPGEVVYQFHTLLQGFLRAHALRTLGTDTVRTLAGHAAAAFERSGWTEEAVDLYLEARQWTDAVRLMQAAVPRLLSESRFGLLQRWMTALPGEQRDGDPRLLYWAGSARVGQDPATARSLFEQAYLLARRHDQAPLAVQCAAAIVETLILEYNDFAGLDRWIEVLNAALAAHDQWESDLTRELRARTALLTAVLYRRGDAPGLAEHAARILQLLHQNVDDDLKLASGAWLLSYGTNLGKLDLAARVLPVVEPLLEYARLSPVRRGFCAYFVAWYAVMRTDRKGTEQALARLRHMASTLDVPILERFALVIEFWAGVVNDPHGDRADTARRFQAALRTGHPYDHGALHTMQAWCSLVDGDSTGGLHAANAAIEAYDIVGSPWHRMLARGIATWASVELGDHGRANELMDELKDIAVSSNVRVYDSYVLQVSAWRALEAGDEDRTEGALRALFSQARSVGRGMPTRFFPAWMPRLATEALRRNIEAPYVRQLVASMGWSPCEPELQEWPFPVRVRMLGRFELEVHGRLVAFHTKAPRRTLALLKALVCLGARDVRDNLLIDALWPDEEADAARAVFNVTLHRLRRLLGNNDAIELTEGCVSLNLAHVWVDAVAFDRLLTGSGTADPRRMERALSLYRGALLPGDADSPWSAVLRERLRTKFVHQVAAVGRGLEAQGDYDAAIGIYLRGLDADPLNESFYRALMRTHHRCGRQAEALTLYQRMQDALSSAFGIQPSEESQALYREMAGPRTPTRSGIPSLRLQGNRRSG